VIIAPAIVMYSYGETKNVALRAVIACANRLLTA